MTRACTTPLGSYRPSSSSRVGSCRQGHLMVGPRCSRSRLASHPALRAVPGGRWASVPDREGPCVRCSGGAGAGGRDTGEAAGVCVQSQARRQGCSGCAGGTENELDRRVITREKLVETLAVSAAEITAVTRAEAGTVPAPLPGKTAPPWQEGLPAARHPAPSYPGRSLLHRPGAAPIADLHQRSGRGQPVRHKRLDHLPMRQAHAHTAWHNSSTIPATSRRRRNSAATESSQTILNYRRRHALTALTPGPRPRGTGKSSTHPAKPAQPHP